MKAIKKKYIYFWIIILFLIQIYFLINYTINGFFFDDAFITYRYAYNLEENNFFTYNLDDPVYGTTTPLYALFLFITRKIINLFSEINYHILSQVASIIFFTALMVFLYLRLKIKGVVFFILFLLIFFNGVNGQVLYSGMETFSVLFLTILFLSNFHNKNVYFFLPFLLFARFDIGLICTLTLITYLIYTYLLDKLPIKFLTKKIAIILAVFLLSFVPAYLFFQELIPNTIFAKSVIYNDTLFEQPLSDRIKRIVRMGFPVAVALIILPTNIFYLFQKIRKKEKKFIQFDIFFWGYFSFLILFVTNLNQWYIPPLAVTASILFILNIKEFISIHGKLFFRRAAFVILIFLAVYTAYADKKIFKDKKNDIYSTELYKISKEIESYAEVFCGDIGIVGFFSKAYVYDYVGLVTPEAIDYNRNKIYYKEAKGASLDFKALKEQIEEVNPDYIILRKIYPFFKPLINDNYIAENYYIKYNGIYDVLLKKNQYVYN